MRGIELSKIIGISYGQVKHTIQSGRASPKRSTGRPPTFMTEQKNEFKAFVRSSSDSQQMTSLELAMNSPR